jgi:hypothetical protein
VEPALGSTRAKVSTGMLLVHDTCGSRLGPTSRSCRRPSLWIGRSIAPRLVRMTSHNLGYPVTPRLGLACKCMLMRGVDGTDFRPSRSGDEADPVASHSPPACRRAMVRRRRLYANLGYPATPRLACMLARGVDGTDFRPSRSCDGTEPVASHSLPACRGAMVRRHRLFAYLGYPVASMHVGVGWT